MLRADHIKKDWKEAGSFAAQVMDGIVRCLTAALGGHHDRCSGCGHQAISYNACRNRHCPKCQGNARARWLTVRSAELLSVPYFHIVFTLPHELSALVLQNRGCSTICSSVPVLPRCSKSLATRSIWMPTSVCSACSIPGDRTPAPSARLLRRTWRWPRPRWLQMGRSLLTLLPACPGSQLRPARQLDRGTQAASARGQAPVSRLAPGTRRTGTLPAFPQAALYQELGRLRQAPFGGAEHVSSLFRPLHPPCRDLEPSPRQLQGRSSFLPLEGLRSRQQAEGHDGLSRRVPAALPHPRSAERPGPHPSLRALR